MAETDHHQPQIYQLRVVLRGISPLISRRLLVRSDSTVAQLHQALQVAFGWEDEHLNRFEIRGRVLPRSRCSSGVKWSAALFFVKGTGNGKEGALITGACTTPLVPTTRDNANPPVIHNPTAPTLPLVSVATALHSSRNQSTTGLEPLAAIPQIRR
jgi:hypothetical protein